MTPLRRVSLLIGAIVALSCDEQQATAPRSALSLNMSAKSSTNPCVQDRDHDKRSAPVQILCAMTVPGNPLSNVAKAWFSHPRNALYIADQSNRGVDVIDLRSYSYAGRVTGFVGVATTGGGTATTNGQGPNSMALAEGHHMWVSDGNGQMQVVDLLSLSIIQTVSTAVAACDGGTATTHYCGRTNEMTYDPDDHVIIVTNPNPLDRTTHAALPPYVTFIDAHPPHPILGTINDMSIDQRDQTVLMPVCGRGEVVFDARDGHVVNVVTEIAGSDETWFNEGDSRFYVAANDPANANTRSLGVIDGRTGLWLQNVPVVGGVIPTASDEPANRAFLTVTASTTGTTACTPFGFAASGCVIVFEHEDAKPDKEK